MRPNFRQIKQQEQKLSGKDRQQYRNLRMQLRQRWRMENPHKFQFQKLVAGLDSNELKSLEVDELNSKRKIKHFIKLLGFLILNHQDEHKSAFHNAFTEIKTLQNNNSSDRQLEPRDFMKILIKYIKQEQAKLNQPLESCAQSRLSRTQSISSFSTFYQQSMNDDDDFGTIDQDLLVYQNQRQNHFQSQEMKKKQLEEHFRLVQSKFIMHKSLGRSYNTLKQMDFEIKQQCFNSFFQITPIGLNNPKKPLLKLKLSRLIHFEQSFKSNARYQEYFKLHDGLMIKENGSKDLTRFDQVLLASFKDFLFLSEVKRIQKQIHIQPALYGYKNAQFIAKLIQTVFLPCQNKLYSDQNPNIQLGETVQNPNLSAKISLLLEFTHPDQLATFLSLDLSDMAQKQVKKSLISLEIAQCSSLEGLLTMPTRVLEKFKKAFLNSIFERLNRICFRFRSKQFCLWLEDFVLEELFQVKYPDIRNIQLEFESMDLLQIGKDSIQLLSRYEFTNHQRTSLKINGIQCKALTFQFYSKALEFPGKNQAIDRYRDERLIVSNLHIN